MRGNYWLKFASSRNIFNFCPRHIHIGLSKAIDDKLSTHGNLVYQYKHPFRDGSTHVVQEPPDFIAPLAGLVEASATEQLS
jgi:hypothetical protein